MVAEMIQQCVNENARAHADEKQLGMGSFLLYNSMHTGVQNFHSNFVTVLLYQTQRTIGVDTKFDILEQLR